MLTTSPTVWFKSHLNYLGGNTNAYKCPANMAATTFASLPYPVDYVVNSHIIRALWPGWPATSQPTPLRTTQLPAPSEFLISTEDSRTMNNYQWHANDFDWVRTHWNQPGVTYGTGLYRHSNTAVAGGADGHVEMLKVPSVIPNAAAGNYPTPDLGQIGDTKNGPALWTGPTPKLYIRLDSTSDPTGADVRYGF